MKPYDVTIQIKPLQQYFHMILMLIRMLFYLLSLWINLYCDHSNTTTFTNGTIHLVCSSNFLSLWIKSCEASSTVLSYDTIIYLEYSSNILSYIVTIQTKLLQW